MLVALVPSDILSLLRPSLTIRGIVAFVCAWVLMMGWHSYPRLSSRLRIGVWVLAVAMSVAGVGAIGATIASNLSNPREWDFLCFWTYGQVMRDGHSPYDQALLRQTAAPYAPSESFQELNYCLYPPPATVLFYPLGFVGLRPAMAGWYAVQLGALALAIRLLHKQLDPERSRLGLWVTLAAATSLFGTIYTFSFAQTTPLILLAVLLGIAAPRWSGIWFGVACVVKPIAAILGVELLVRRAWRGLVGLLAVPALATTLFLVLQGSEGLASWREQYTPPAEMQHAYFTEEMNQSLLAVIVRWSDVRPGTHALTYPAFVLSAILLTVTTWSVLVRITRANGAGAVEYLLTLALLIYPGTLIHYSILLLIPMAFVARHAPHLRGNVTGAALLWGGLFCLSWIHATFAANLVMWLYLTVQLALTTVMVPEAGIASSGGASRMPPSPR